MKNFKLLSVLLLCMAVVFTSCGTWNNTAKGTAIGVGGGAAVGAGVGALAARSGVIGAFLNVKINAAGLDNKEYANDIISRGEKVVEMAKQMETDILNIVNSKI